MRMPSAMLPEAALQVPQRYVVVTVSDPMNLPPHAASTPKGYDNLATYHVGSVALRTSRAIAVTYRLREVTSWPITTLSVACIVYQLPADADTLADRDRMLAALVRDGRITSAQALSEFTAGFDSHRQAGQN
jgi:hypothetical protein